MEYKSQTVDFILYRNGQDGRDGAAGKDGAAGTGVDSCVTEFYLSTSKATPTGGEWGETMPEWSVGSYVWTRLRITYTDGTVAYTEPECDASWEAAEDVETRLQETIRSKEASILTTAEQIALSVRSDCVEQDEYNTFKAAAQSKLTMLDSEIGMSFTRQSEQISRVGDEVTSRFTTQDKYITFSEKGIAVSAGGDAPVLNMDNDEIQFKQGDAVLGRWDGTDFYTGNIKVQLNERAQFGNFAFVPRSDGGMVLLKVEHRGGCYVVRSGRTAILYGTYPKVVGTTAIIDAATVTARVEGTTMIWDAKESG